MRNVIESTRACYWTRPEWNRPEARRTAEGAFCHSRGTGRQ